MYSIDRASTIASRAVASSSTNDERFPIPDSQSNQSIRSASPDACVLFLFPPRVGQADHRSRLITDPPSSPNIKYLSRRTTKSTSNNRTDRMHRSNERPHRSNESTDRSRRHSRARRWRHDDHLDDDLDDDDDDDAVVGGVEERGETGGESSGERVGGIGTTRYGR